MKIDVAPGKYVLAVSGGVDSMVLLHLLAGDKGFEPGSFVVAHYDHGIRADSAKDRKLVQAVAEQLGLPFIYKEGQLGVQASEDLARRKRYEFLREVALQHNAQAVITAHHQDDMLETALLNLLRGTGRRGLSSLRSRVDIVRPLLHLPKAEIMQYAHAHDITWREDATNLSPRYRRNQVRMYIMPKLSVTRRAQLQQHITRARQLNDEIDILLAELLAVQPSAQTLDRGFFIQLPHAVSCELMAAWLRRLGVTFDRRTIDRLVVFAKTAKFAKRADLDASYFLEASKKHITLQAHLGNGSV